MSSTLIKILDQKEDSSSILTLILHTSWKNLQIQIDKYFHHAITCKDSHGELNQ